MIPTAKRGPDAVQDLPEGIRNSEGAVAETIENNVRKLIIDETPINPKYYEKMSKLLDALIEARRRGVLDYRQYLTEVAELTKQAANPGGDLTYPPVLDTLAKRALYDNLGQNEGSALRVDRAVQGSRQDDWRNNPIKVKRVRLAIKAVVEPAAQSADSRRTWESQGEYVARPDEDIDTFVDCLLELVKNQHEY